MPLSHPGAAEPLRRKGGRVYSQLTTARLGSRYSKDAMSQVGAGQQIDCGVTYTAPGTYGLTANITWDAC
jgi:hypothetical protein